MGKSLIIKGADFSQVAVSDPTLEWFIDRYSDEKAFALGRAYAGGYIPGDYANVQGKRINRIKLMPKDAGIMTIGVADGVGVSANFSQVREISFTSEEADTAVIKSFEEIIVPSNGYICVEFGSNASVPFGYQNSGTGGAGFYFYVGKSSASGEITNIGTHDLNISFGYYG